MWTFTIKTLHSNPWWHTSGLAGLVCLNDCDFFPVSFPNLLSFTGASSVSSVCDHVMHHEAPHLKKIHRCISGVEWRQRQKCHEVIKLKPSVSQNV